MLHLSKLKSNFSLWKISIAKETGRETWEEGEEKRRKVETEGGRKEDTWGV